MAVNLHYVYTIDETACSMLALTTTGGRAMVPFTHTGGGTQAQLYGVKVECNSDTLIYVHPDVIATCPYPVQTVLASCDKIAL